MKTWHFESAFAAVVLVSIALWRNQTVEWVGAVAVWLTFGHVSIASRMAERQAIKEKPDVDCYRWLVWHLVAKEILWCIYFVLLESYTALFGVALFLFHPLWRRWYRRWHPLNR